MGHKSKEFKQVQVIKNIECNFNGLFFSLSISLKTTKINNKQTEWRMGSDPQHHSLG